MVYHNEVMIQLDSNPGRVKSKTYKIDNCHFLGLVRDITRIEGQGPGLFSIRIMRLSGILGHDPDGKVSQLSCTINALYSRCSKLVTGLI